MRGIFAALLGWIALGGIGWTSGNCLTGSRLAAQTAEPPLPMATLSPWVMDQLITITGTRFQGLILDESPRGVDFQVVYRRAGRPTVTLRTRFDKKEIAQLVRISPAERRKLSATLESLDPTGDGELQQLEAVVLTEIPWLNRRNPGWGYTSDRFVLRSGASESLTRRVVVRLEQLMAALERYLPAHIPRRSIRIDLASQPEDYLALLPPRWLDVSNPAVFLPQEGRIVLSTDIEPLEERLAQIRLRHRATRQKLDAYELQVRKLYAKAPTELTRYLQSIQSERQRISEADRVNRRALEQASQRGFARFAHELIHAVLIPSLGPNPEPNRPASPPWPRYLEEGYAQLFETAIVEANELRIDGVDPQRLAKVREWFQAASQPTSLRELLLAKPEDYLKGHQEPAAASQRLYLAAWAAAFYLVREKNGLLGSGFSEYLQQLARGDDPVRAAEVWLGQSVEEFDRDWHGYLQRIRTDGTLEPAPGPANP